MRVHTYTTGNGGAQTRQVEPTARLTEIVALEADEHAYRLGEESELDVELTVAELFGDGPGHVIVHRCRRIAVTVAYGGRDTAIEAHPATHLRTVRERAVKAFGISPADAADLVLRLPGSTTDLNLAEPVGALVSAHTCSLSLDLIHTVRPQG